jgi:hypothetical protein
MRKGMLFDEAGEAILEEVYLWLLELFLLSTQNEETL